VATVYYSAASRPLPPLPEGSLRSQASSPATPARKKLDFEASNLSRNTTVIDVSVLNFLLKNRLTTVLFLEKKKIKWV
jgi:hypothetical protein